MCILFAFIKEEKVRRGHVVLTGIVKVSLFETVKYEQRPKQAEKLVEQIHGGRTFQAEKSEHILKLGSHLTCWRNIKKTQGLDQ